MGLIRTPGLERVVCCLVIIAISLASGCGSPTPTQEVVPESVTQLDYDGVADSYLDCVRERVPGVDASYSPNRTYPGGEVYYQYTFGLPEDSDALDTLDLEMQKCESEVEGFVAISAAWEAFLSATYPEAFADIEYENVVACLRENGLDVADTSTESLNAAIAADEDVYFECYDAEAARVREFNAPGR